MPEKGKKAKEKMRLLLNYAHKGLHYLPLNKCVDRVRLFGHPS